MNKFPLLIHALSVFINFLSLRHGNVFAFFSFYAPLNKLFFLFIFIWLAAVSPISRFFHNVQCHSNSGELAESFLRPIDCFWISITNPESMTKRLNRWKGLDRWKFLSDHNSTRLMWQWRSTIWIIDCKSIPRRNMHVHFCLTKMMAVNKCYWLFSLKWA